MILVNAGSKLRWTLVSATAASILAVILPGCGLRDEEERCRAITAIARDAQKMRYAKDWIASHLSDKRFLESLRSRRTFKHDDERLPEFGSLDWKYLGFSEQFASLQFNLGISDSGEWDIDRIDSVSLQQGRNFIVIRLSSAKDMGLDWPQEELERKIEAVGEDVFVYCDSRN